MQLHRAAAGMRRPCFFHRRLLTALNSCPSGFAFSLEPGSFLSHASMWDFRPGWSQFVRRGYFPGAEASVVVIWSEELEVHLGSAGGGTLAGQEATRFVLGDVALIIMPQCWSGACVARDRTWWQRTRPATAGNVPSLPLGNHHGPRFK